MRIVVAIGEESAGEPPHRSCLALAAALGQPAVALPGGHGGFGQPGFGERLREVLFVAPDRH